MIREKTRLKGIVKPFSVDFNLIDTYDILDINKYLMKGTWCKIMFGIIKKMLIVLLRNIVDGSNHTKCMLVSNQKLWLSLLL